MPLPFLFLPMNKSTTFLLGAALALGLSAAAIGQEQPAPAKFKLDAGLVFARGDYGLAEDTDVWLWLVNPTLESRDWRVQASVPYVRLNGPASVVGGTGTGAANRTADGLGDVSLTLTRLFAADQTGWGTELGAKVKFPTADETKGLGTGEYDYAIQFDAYRAGATFTPYFNVGYQFLGSNAAYVMEDGLYATGGVLARASASTTVGLLGSWRERTFAGGDAGAEAMAFLQHTFGAGPMLKLFAMRGFTDASPDIAFGLMLGWNY